MLSGDLVLQSGHGDLTAHLTVGCSAQQTLIGGCFGLQVAERGTPRRLVCSAPLINCSALSRWPDLIAHSAHSTILRDWILRIEQFQPMHYRSVVFRNFGQYLGEAIERYILLPNNAQQRDGGALGDTEPVAEIYNLVRYPGLA